MRPRQIHTLARVLGKRARLGAMSATACALVFAACGDSDEPEPSIPQPAGDAIVAALDRVEERVEAGQCDAAQGTAQNIRDAIAALPAGVPEDLKQALIQGSDNLIEQTQDQCEPTEPPEPEVPTGATGETGVEE